MWGATMRDVHRLLVDGPLACGLILHHKERNVVGNAAVEFAWVTAKHASTAL